MKPATPLPWNTEETTLTIVRGFITPEEVDAFQLRGENSASVGYLHRGEEKHKANAAYIVHAANAYPKLVEALKSVVNDLAYGTTGRWKGDGSKPLFDLLSDLGES